MTIIHGPDVSFYQNKPDTPQRIDFQKMREAGASFVIIRAGQNLWEDSEFDISWQAAKGVLPRGTYWFYDSRIDPKFQAKKWLSCFNDQADLGELPHWGDFEDTYGGKFGRWQDWYDFLEELKRLRPGIRLGVYTGYWYWRERTIAKSIPTASLNYFKQYPLWIANYKVNTPLIPEPWNAWTLWQYTDSGNGRQYGVESNEIDLNYFQGDFQAFAGSMPTSQPEEPKPETKPDPIVSGRLITKFGRVVEIKL